MAAAGAFKVLGAAVSKILGPLSAVIFVFEILRMVVSGLYSLLTTDALENLENSLKKLMKLYLNLQALLGRYKGIEGSSSVLTSAAQNSRSLMEML